ncbi:VOC family protein [Scytonema sp. NUACC26]|uniref:VOC family protein n=1 Tax=Scytonema sp. NUACC26 TaxID=3140176 RepID=UPI0038B2A126
MNNLKTVFHIAIPCRDLEEAEDFYIKKLQCKLGRKYSDRITLNFFDTQLVCHLYPEKIDSNPQIYPRHFGVIFNNQDDFSHVINLAKQQNIEFIQETVHKRQGEAAEQLTFYLKDPSNNIIQFKLFLNSEMVY